MFPCVSFPGHVICSVCTPIEGQSHSQATRLDVWLYLSGTMCVASFPSLSLSTRLPKPQVG